jgi:hypothetical protein
MRHFKKKPQMTSKEFKTALREAGLGSNTAAIRCAASAGRARSLMPARIIPHPLGRRPLLGDGTLA